MKAQASIAVSGEGSWGHRGDTPVCADGELPGGTPLAHGVLPSVNAHVSQWRGGQEA